MNDMCAHSIYFGLNFWVCPKVTGKSWHEYKRRATTFKRGYPKQWRCSPMDELEIKIALSYKVPESDLTFNGILRGLQEDQNTLMKTIVRTILSALEERAIQEYILAIQIGITGMAISPGLVSLSVLSVRSATEWFSSLTGKQKRSFLLWSRSSRSFPISNIREKRWRRR